MSKPVTAPTWATDATFSSGPAIGAPTKVPPAGWPDVAQGLVPGEAAAAEFLNELFNALCDWTTWLDGGSSAGAADAHLVETDASGETTLRALNLDDGVSVPVRMTALDGVLARQGAIPDSDSNIEGGGYDTWLCATPGAQRDHYLLEAGCTHTPLVAGQRTTIYRPAAGSFAIIIHREGEAGALVTLASATHCGATFEVRGGRWRLLLAGAGATPGADA